MWVLEAILAPLVVSVASAVLVAKHEIQKSRRRLVADRAIDELSTIQRLAIRYWNQNGQLPDLEFEIKGSIAIFRRFVSRIGGKCQPRLVSLASDLNRKITGASFETASRKADAILVESISQKIQYLHSEIEKSVK